jgi:hypothetical protein
MGTGYTRNDTVNNIADGNVINASDLDGEFDAIQSAFDASTGHSHDGTTGEGPQIDTAGIANDAVTLGTKTSGNYVAAGAVSGVGLSGSASSEGATFTVTSNATDANTASTIVARDASGNFSAGTITASLTGTASNAALLDSLDSTQFLRSDAADTKTSGDLTFADNVKANFGAGSDLQIYHTGASSIIKDVGTGTLWIGGSTEIALGDPDITEYSIRCFDDGAVSLYYDNSTKLATTATGIDVTGTITSDGLIVDTTTLYVDSTNDRIGIRTSSPQTALVISNNGAEGIEIDGYNASAAAALIQAYNRSASAFIPLELRASQLEFNIGGSEAMRIDSGNLVVGATSAYATNAITAGVGGILYSRRTSGGPLTLRRDSTDGAIATFEKDGTTVGVIGSQYWGIGTGSPSRPLDVVADANDNPLRLRARGGGTSAYITFSSNDATTTNALIGNPAANTLAFYTNGFSERMRLDASGNLLVGKTANSIAGAGVVIRGGGELFSTRAGDVAGFNRLTTDGQIVQFYKDGSVVGGIGVKVRTSQGRISVGNSNTRLLFDNGVDAIIPADNDGNDRDNALDLGQSGARFDDIYATNGTIQTSDQNEKQQIASLTDAEITAAKAISQLFKTFKWNDKVAAKGDAARTHTGVIAQDVEAAMTAAGLDAGDYAFFISTDWYVDADGNEVEADAEGAIAKNRKGIRYPELLSFVGAATEQRLANIETRLAALEAN